MPLPISPDSDSGSKSSSPDNAVPAEPVGAAAAAAEPVEPPVASPVPAPSAAPPHERLRAARQLLVAGGQIMIQVAAVGFACLAYAYLTLPDVRPLRTS